MLQVRGLDVHYGQAHVLQGVTLEIGTTPLAVIGRNGMGKTTLCQTLMGLVAASGGEARIEGRPILGLAPNKVAAQGIALVPQGRRTFPSLTVHEHLVLAARGKRPRWTIERIYETFPASPSAGAMAARSSRAVSSRCWRSAAPCSATRASSSWTSRAKGLPP
jgi:branched-chain amino acid transport system ATP-binding protein